MSTIVRRRFVFTIVFLLNMFLVFAGSSGAVPFGTMLLIVVMWFGISAPLTSIGFYFGSKHGVSSSSSCTLVVNADCREDLAYQPPGQG